MFIQLMPLFSAVMAVIILMKNLNCIILLEQFLWYLVFIYRIKKSMIKVAVLDDYQNAFQQIVEVDKIKINLILKFLTNLFQMKKKLLLN